ncbi:MAG TPA: NADH-quinone oxidoreductase subunit J [Burkholderiaceae bacterium]|nr:NADH-quinone oxidoreductase subunit J [Burkholderiaceae bacterium]
MNYQAGFFYFFSAVLLFASLRVITAKNPVHAVLFLMLAFSQAAAVWLILKAEFLGLTLVLVYLGAVMVLFLFVVMMLDIRVDKIREGFWKHAPLGLLLGGLIAFELAAVLWTGFSGMSVATGGEFKTSNTHQLGVLLFTQYLYPIQAAAVILLVAMIAAIALTLRHRKDSKAISPSLQVHVKAADRLVVVKMPASGATQNNALAAEEGIAK